MSFQTGCLFYFFVEDWKFVNEFRHVVGKELHYTSVLTRMVGMFSQIKKSVLLVSSGIRKLFVDQSGTKLVFLDDKSDGYIYCPVISDIAALICMLAYQ